jgi:hypothetical protein
MSFKVRWNVVAGRALMLIAETLAVISVAVQFLLPTETAIAVHIGHRSLGLPIRWVVPLLLIAIAGALSLVALVAMYWRLAQVPISAAGQ